MQGSAEALGCGDDSTIPVRNFETLRNGDPRQHQLLIGRDKRLARKQRDPAPRFIRRKRSTPLADRIGIELGKDLSTRSELRCEQTVGHLPFFAIGRLTVRRVKQDIGIEKDISASDQNVDAPSTFLPDVAASHPCRPFFRETASATPR